MSKRVEVPIGTRFGYWVTVGEVYSTPNKKCRYVDTECDCGTHRTAEVGNLVAGKSKSCGCLVAERNMQRRDTAPWKCETCGSADVQYACRRKGKVATRAYCQSSPSCRTAYRHRLSLAEYQDRLNGGCEMCGSKKKLHIDHDHTICTHSSRSSGSCERCFRGVLCAVCNLLVGQLEATLAPEAITYLLRTSSSSPLIAYLAQLSPDVPLGSPDEETRDSPHAS